MTKAKSPEFPAMYLDTIMPKGKDVTKRQFGVVITWERDGSGGGSIFRIEREDGDNYAGVYLGVAKKWAEMPNYGRIIQPKRMVIGRCTRLDEAEALIERGKMFWRLATGAVSAAEAAAHAAKLERSRTFDIFMRSIVPGKKG